MKRRQVAGLQKMEAAQTSSKFLSLKYGRFKRPVETSTLAKAAMVEFSNSDPNLWREALSSYPLQVEALAKPNLVSLDQFYRNELPLLLHTRNPNPHITTSELSKLMQWKLTRGKWRPRLLDFVSALDESLVESASRKAFHCLPDVSKAVSELTPLKGVGPATASAVLAAYAPDLAPFMSDEAMEAALGHSKDYSLKQYLLFANKLQHKAKELSSEEQIFTASDVERALWSTAIGERLKGSKWKLDPKNVAKSGAKRKRKA